MDTRSLNIFEHDFYTQLETIQSQMDPGIQILFDISLRLNLFNHITTGAVKTTTPVIL